MSLDKCMHSTSPLNDTGWIDHDRHRIARKLRFVSRVFIREHFRKSQSEHNIAKITVFPMPMARSQERVGTAEYLHQRYSTDDRAGHGSRDPEEVGKRGPSHSGGG